MKSKRFQFLLSICVCICQCRPFHLYDFDIYHTGICSKDKISFIILNLNLIISCLCTGSNVKIQKNKKQKQYPSIKSWKRSNEHEPSFFVVFSIPRWATCSLRGATTKFVRILIWTCLVKLFHKWTFFYVKRLYVRPTSGTIKIKCTHCLDSILNIFVIVGVSNLLYNNHNQLIIVQIIIVQWNDHQFELHK